MARTGTTSIHRAGRLTVYDLFQVAVRASPNGLALATAGRTMSLGELDRRVRRLANQLHREGIGHGDRIALLSENRAEFVECMLAATALGAIVACQNWRLSVPELEDYVTLVTPKLAIVSPRHATSLAATNTAVAEVLEFGPAYEASLADGDETLPDTAIDPEDGLLIIYTSGTMGMPKGALVSHRAQVARMIVVRMDLCVAEDDAFVAWAPMFHMVSANQVLGTLMGGGPVIVVDGFDIRAIVDAIRDQKIGRLVLMPVMIEQILAMIQAEAIIPRGIKVAGAMADLVPKTLIADISRALRAPYLNSFGSTETGLPPASRRLLPEDIVPETVSKRQSSLCDIRLLDPDGHEVADGDTGEVAMRGPTLFKGYWNAAETNARDFGDALSAWAICSVATLTAPMISWTGRNT